MYPDQNTHSPLINSFPDPTHAKNFSLSSFKILRSKLLHAFHPDRSSFSFEQGSSESIIQNHILRFIQNQEYSSSGEGSEKLQLIESALCTQLPDTHTLTHIAKIIAEPLVPPRLVLINQNLSTVSQNLNHFIPQHNTLPLINNIKLLTSILATINTITYLHPEHLVIFENLVIAVDFRVQLTRLMCTKIQSFENISSQELQNCLLELVEFAYTDASLIAPNPKFSRLLKNFKLNKIFLNSDY